MPITYTIISNFTEIGTCEGLPVTEQGRPFVLIHPSYLGVVSVGDTLVSPAGQYLKIYMDDYVLENNELRAIKFFYE